MAAATRHGKAIIFTAVTDTYTGIVDVAGISFQGTGLTATNRVLLTDTDGSEIADYIVEGASDNGDLWNGRPPQIYQGLKMTGTVDGTWKLTVFLN